MPEVSPRYGALRIYVHLDDHDPPHVHVHSDEGSVTINLGIGCVELDDSETDMKTSDIRRAERLVLARLDACWELWRRHHGEINRIRRRRDSPRPEKGR